MKLFVHPLEQYNQPGITSRDDISNKQPFLNLYLLDMNKHNLLFHITYLDSENINLSFYLV